MILKIKYLFF